MPKRKHSDSSQTSPDRASKAFKFAKSLKRTRSISQEETSPRVSKAPKLSPEEVSSSTSKVLRRSPRLQTRTARTKSPAANMPFPQGFPSSFHKDPVQKKEKKLLKKAEESGPSRNTSITYGPLPEPLGNLEPTTSSESSTQSSSTRHHVWDKWSKPKSPQPHKRPRPTESHHQPTRPSQRPSARTQIQRRVTTLQTSMSSLSQTVHIRKFLLALGQRKHWLGRGDPETDEWERWAKHTLRVYAHLEKRIREAGEHAQVQQVEVWEERMEWLSGGEGNYSDVWEGQGWAWDKGVEKGVFKEGWCWEGAVRDGGVGVEEGVGPLE